MLSAGVVQGFPSRVCHVPQLLPRAALRRGTRLHVSAPALQNPLQDPQPPVRLHLRLDDAQAEGRRKCSWGVQYSPKYAAAAAPVVCSFSMGWCSIFH